MPINEDRIENLCLNFTRYITAFDTAGIFSGPSLYFHHQTINRLKKHLEFKELFDDSLFFEYLYATLASWGLHRMGKTYTKLVDFPVLFDSIRSQKEAVIELKEKNILKLREHEVPSVGAALWDIISHIKVSASRTRIVAGSKALHHILPQLLPPIDREYTLTFFYYKGKPIQDKEEDVFKELFTGFAQIAQRNQVQIKSTIGPGLHTSETKVIDNSIVGFILNKKNLQVQ